MYDKSVDIRAHMAYLLKAIGIDTKVDATVQ